MYSYLKANGKAMGSGGWSVDNDSANPAWTGLWQDGEVVALLVSDNDPDRLHRVGNEIVTACNAHAGLVEALKKIAYGGFEITPAVVARAALESAGIK